MVPAAELQSHGLGDLGRLDAKVTPNGTIHHARLQDALALVVATPVRSEGGRITHILYGAEIVKNIRHRFIGEVSLAVRHHHERWDGKGYPDGLPSEKSCRTSRILAVADTYDAMTSDRPYRKGFPAEKAVAVLRETAGTQLDPEFVGAFLEAHSSGAIAAAAGDGKAVVKSKYSAQASIDTGKFPPVRGRGGA